MLLSSPRLNCCFAPVSVHLYLTLISIIAQNLTNETLLHEKATSDNLTEMILDQYKKGQHLAEPLRLLAGMIQKS